MAGVALTEDEAKRFPEYAKALPHMNDPESEAIGDFVVWLGENGYVICVYSDERYCCACSDVYSVDACSADQTCPDGHATVLNSGDPQPAWILGPEGWIAARFGIDYVQYQKERDVFLREVLDAQLALNERVIHDQGSGAKAEVAGTGGVNP